MTAAEIAERAARIVKECLKHGISDPALIAAAIIADRIAGCEKQLSNIDDRIMAMGDR